MNRVQFLPPLMHIQFLSKGNYCLLTAVHYITTTHQCVVLLDAVENRCLLIRHLMQ